MTGRVNCNETVKDKITGLNRQCRKTASAGQTPTLCHICLRKLQRSSNPHIAAEPTPPATPTDPSDTTIGIAAAPIASQNAALTLTPRKAGQNVATTDTTTTPHTHATTHFPTPHTHATIHFPTPQKAIQLSSTDGNLAIRRDVFRNNLKS